MLKEWYILQVISGKEKMAVGHLNLLKKSYEQQEEKKDFIGEIRIPEEEVFKITGGKKKLLKQRILPGYVLIELSLPDDVVAAKRVYSDIVMSQGVATFVGMKDGIPYPVDRSELEDIFNRMGEGSKVKSTTARIAVVIDFEEGEMIKVSEGPFRGLLGKIEDIDAERKKVRVKLEIFGMPTTVELDVVQVEKSY